MKWDLSKIKEAVKAIDFLLDNEVIEDWQHADLFRDILYVAWWTPEEYEENK